MTTQHQSRALRIAVVGGSMAGLFAALGLRRAGVDVHVYERTAVPLAGRGAGIVTHPQLHAALATVGVSLSDAHSVSVNRRCSYDATGALLDTVAFPQVTTSWDRLYEALRAAFPDDRFHAGKALTSINRTGDRTTLRFADASTAEADLVIGADGIRSAVRSIVAPDAAPEYAGYVGWRAIVDDEALSPSSRVALRDVFAFCLPVGEQALIYPVAGAGGKRRYNLVWYRPADARNVLPSLLTGTDGKVHDSGIPPTLIRREVLDTLRADAARLLSPAIVEVIDRCPQLLLQPIYDLTVPRMVRDRTVLIGDAAFVARPHVGAGVTKAAEDAIALCAALTADTDVDHALHNFDSERRAVGYRIIAEARRLGASIGTGQLSSDQAHALMRDTASLAFLDP